MALHPLLPKQMQQDLFSGRVREIGRERDDLYFLQRHGSKKLTAISLVAAGIKSHRRNSTIDISLWHKILGHVSSIVLKKLFPAKLANITDIINKCTFVVFVQTQFNKVLKAVKSDNGSEFVNSVCHVLFQKYSIIHQKTRAYTPQQNGVVERKHKHILEEPILEHLRVLGCLCYVKQVQETDKLLGQTYYSYGDVSFREDIFPFKESHSSPPVFLSSDRSTYGADYISTSHEPHSSGHASSPSTSTNLSTTGDDSSQEAPEQLSSTTEGVSTLLPSADQHTTSLRRSLRTKHTHIWLKDFVIGPSYKYVPYYIANYISYDGVSPKYQCYLAVFSSIVEPTTFEEAVKDLRWVDAMQCNTS
nr:PREDICTED: uncharacterized protein LOC107812310 [Nicotiana tabacum]